MVLTVNNFTGFGTEGYEELSDTTGSPPINTVKHKSGNAALELEGLDTVEFPWVRGGVTDAGADYIFGIVFKQELVTPGAWTVASVKDDIGIEIFRIRGNSSGQIELRGDPAGSDTLLDTSSVLVFGQFYVVEVYAQINNASANWEWFINNVSEGSGSGADLTAGNSFGGVSSSILFGSPGTGDVSYLDAVYVLSGATAASDRLGPFEVYMKQGAQIGTTPDIATASTGVLDEGSWDLASETPLNEQTQGNAASYTSTADDGGMVYADGSGDKLGPSSDDRFLGTTIKAIKGIWRMARSGGGGTAQFGLVGNDGGAGSDREETTDLDIGTGYANFEYLTETAAVLPAITENAAIGFRKGSGGQDMDMAEMWLMILTVPAAPDITALSDSDLEYPDQNYFVGPHEI